MILPWLEMQTVVPPSAVLVQVTKQGPTLAGLWADVLCLWLALLAFALPDAFTPESGSRKRRPTITNRMPLFMNLTSPFAAPLVSGCAHLFCPSIPRPPRLTPSGAAYSG